MTAEAHVERLATYTPEDAAGIGRLMPFLSTRMNDAPIPEELLRQIIESPYHEQFVARLDSIIIGAATVSLLLGPAAGRVGYLEDFVTDPEVRGQGIGHRIWEEMMRWCSENGVALEFTSKPTRTDAHKFYRAHGAETRETTVFHVSPDEA